MNTSGLKKVYVINSRSTPTLWMEIDVSSTTQITGTNGAGKTSFLRLIPFFYGAEGRRISRKSRVHSSFVDWYLPRIDSYIVFEYITNRQNTAHVICYQHSSTNQVCYRFANGEFNRDVIIKTSEAGLSHAIPSNQLAEELTRQGVDYAPLVTNVKKYRNIIQNVDPASFENQYASFSLCSGWNDIKHIEKITASILQGAFSVADTKHLFLEILGMDMSDVNFGIEANQVERWCNDYEGLTAFAKNAAPFEAALVNNNTIVQHSSFLHLASDLFNDEMQRLRDKEIPDKKEQLDQLAEQHSEKTGKLEQQRELVMGDVQELAIAIEALKKHIEQQEDKALTYEEQGMEELSVKLESLPDKIERLSSKQKAYEEIEKKIGDLEIWRKKRETEIALTFTSGDAKIGNKLSENRIEESDKLLALEEKHNREKALAEQSHREKLDQNNREIQALTTEEVRLQFSIESPSPDPVLAEQKEAINRLLQENTANQIQVGKSLRETQSELNKQRELRNESSARLTQFTQDEQRLTEELEAVQRRLDPDSGTLFSFLEAKVENWQESPLGKVLSESLLLNDKLDPEITENYHSVYGLQIDTSSLEPCQVTNKRDQERLSALLDALDQIDKEKSETEKLLKKLLKEVQALERDEIELTAKLNAFTSEEEMHRASLSNKQIEIDKEIVSRLERLNKELSSVTKRLKKLNSLNKEASEGYEDLISGMKGTMLEEKANIQTYHAQRHSALEEDKQQLAQTRKNDLQRLQTELETRLSKSEVSHEHYELYKKEISELNDEIDFLRRKSPEIESYRDWLRTYTQSQPEKKQQKQDKEKLHLEKSIQRDEINTELKQLAEAFRTKRNALELAVKTAMERAQRYESNIDRINVNVVLSDVEAIDYRFNQDFSTLVGEVDSKLNELKNLKLERTQQLRNLEEITRLWGDGELLRLWRETTERMHSHSENDSIKALGEIIRHIIPQITSMTIASASNMGSMLVNFKDNMLSFEGEIKRLGRQISAEVRASNSFDIVGSIDINVASSLNRLSGWEDINMFSAVYKEWEQSGGTELPSKKFFSTLKAVSNHINDDKLTRPIELFDIKFDVIENGNKKTAVSDKDMEELASNGTNLLIQSMLYIALIASQRKSSQVEITFPTDEVGKLASDNLSKLISLMNDNRFNIVAALPDGKAQTMQLFKNLYRLTDRGAVTNKAAPTRIGKAIARKAEESQR